MGSATSLHGLTQRCCRPHLSLPPSCARVCQDQEPSADGSTGLRHCGSRSSRGSCCLHRCCQEAELGPLLLRASPPPARRIIFWSQSKRCRGDFFLHRSPHLGYLSISGNLHLSSLRTLNCPQFSSKAPARLSNYCLNRRKEEEVSHREKRKTNIQKHPAL